MVEGVPAHFQVRFRGGLLYIRTDWEASNFRLMVADPERPAIGSWRELIPESDDLLESFEKNLKQHLEPVGLMKKPYPFYDGVKPPSK